jgi:hypothetical protein
MISLSFETKKDQETILDEAERYFVENVGLKITERDPCCISFEDQNKIGYVHVSLTPIKDKYEVDVISKEFEYNAKEFVENFK